MAAIGSHAGRPPAVRIVGMAIVAASTAIVLLRAGLAPVPPRPRAPTPEQRRLAYEEIATKEAGDRLDGRESFPNDAWSADDDYHNKESNRARDVAREQGVSTQEVLRAFDDGMRERWALPPIVKPRASVPPCRPRPVY